jgi:hypothetical protein
MFTHTISRTDPAKIAHYLKTEGSTCQKCPVTRIVDQILDEVDFDKYLVIPMMLELSVPIIRSFFHTASQSLRKRSMSLHHL